MVQDGASFSSSVLVAVTVVVVGSGVFVMVVDNDEVLILLLVVELFEECGDGMTSCSGGTDRNFVELRELFESVESSTDVLPAEVVAVDMEAVQLVLGKTVTDGQAVVTSQSSDKSLSLRLSLLIPIL